MTEEASDPEALHRAKMARIKAAKDRLYAGKTGEKGLLMGGARPRPQRPDPCLWRALLERHLGVALC